MQEEEIEIMAAVGQIVLQSPGRQQVNQRRKPGKFGQFGRMLEVMREWKNHTVNMGNRFVRFEQRIMPRFDHRMSVCREVGDLRNKQS